jgi:hypothetical protein
MSVLILFEIFCWWCQQMERESEVRERGRERGCLDDGVKQETKKEKAPHASINKWENDSQLIFFWTVKVLSLSLLSPAIMWVYVCVCVQHMWECAAWVKNEWQMRCCVWGKKAQCTQFLKWVGTVIWFQFTHSRHINYHCMIHTLWLLASVCVCRVSKWARPKERTTRFIFIYVVDRRVCSQSHTRKSLNQSKFKTKMTVINHHQIHRCFQIQFAKAHIVALNLLLEVGTV